MSCPVVSGHPADAIPDDKPSNPTVSNQGYINVSLPMTASRPSYTLNQGPGGIGVTATPSVPGPYYISIYDDTGAQVCSNYAQSYCNTSGYAPVGGTRTYTAYIAQDAPNTGRPVSDVRAWATATVSGQSTTSQTTDGIDQAQLAALIDQLDPAAVSEQLLGFTASGLGTHVLDSSISDQQAVYEAEIAAGKRAGRQPQVLECK